MVLLFFLLTTAVSWACWGGAYWLNQTNTDPAVVDLFIRLGLFGPTLTAITLTYFTPSESPPNPPPSPNRTLLRHGLLFLGLLGLMLLLLNLYKSVGVAPRLSWLTIVADAVLAGVVAAVLTWRWAGTPAVQDLLAPLYQWWVAPRWYLLALLLFPLLAYTPLLFTHGRNLAPLNTAVASTPWQSIPLLILLTLLIGGPLGEEVGWRGYALPRLQAAYSDYTASLILGVVWALWHTPLYLIPVYSGGWSALLARVGWMLPLTFLFTLLHRRTNGSLWLILWLHTSFNLAPLTPTPLNFLLLLLIGGGAILALRE